ncbi:MAG: hypothetical protein IPN95_27960 [Bacteroidetes bacterium]|nr:hypothetical protein [Bacteroidota bacterium]
MKLHRLIVVKNLESTKLALRNPDSSVAKIAKMHADGNANLSFLPLSTLKKNYLLHNLNQEYLDFLLIEGRVIYGFKNDRNYETVTAFEKYVVFIKDSKSDLGRYKDFIKDVIALSHTVTF